MKKLLVLLSVGVLILLVSAPSEARVYTWTDSLSVTSTAADTTFPTRWNGCTFWTEGCDLYFRYGTNATDTTSWNSKKWQYLEDGQPFYLWSNAYYENSSLWRIEYKCTSGQTGALFITGVKTEYSE